MIQERLSEIYNEERNLDEKLRNLRHERQRLELTQAMTEAAILSAYKHFVDLSGMILVYGCDDSGAPYKYNFAPKNTFKEETYLKKAGDREVITVMSRYPAQIAAVFNGAFPYLE